MEDGGRGGGIGSHLVPRLSALRRPALIARGRQAGARPHVPTRLDQRAVIIAHTRRTNQPTPRRSFIQQRTDDHGSQLGSEGGCGSPGRRRGHPVRGSLGFWFGGNRRPSSAPVVVACRGGL